VLGYWEHYEHPPDLGVRGFGESKAEAFEQAALAMTAAVADPGMVRPFDSIALLCRAPDDERMLVEWLNAVAREMAVRRMLFSKFKVRLQDGSLTGEARGEMIDPARHRPAMEVKRATSATARVARHADGWVAQAVIDV
jgi:SHS2 domain-containing protein